MKKQGERKLPPKQETLKLESSALEKSTPLKKRKIVGIADEVTFDTDAYSLRYEELISFIISTL